MAVLKFFAYFTNKIYFFAVFLQYGLFICKAEVYYVFCILRYSQRKREGEGRRERKRLTITKKALRPIFTQKYVDRVLTYLNVNK